MTVNNNKSFSGGRMFYVVLTLCLTALGLGTWGAVKLATDLPDSDTPPSSEVESEIDWDNEGIRDITIIYDDDMAANTPADNIPDTRDSTSEAISETQPRTDNIPYTGNFVMPLGNSIIKDFSNGEMVRSKTMGDWRIHSGIDFGDTRGQSVLSIQDGIVTAVYDDDMWGTVMIIDHGNGLVATYCGLTSGSTLAVGHQVEQHEIIGTLGEIPCEKDDGPHLHFEISVNGITVDPLKAMNKIG